MPISSMRIAPIPTQTANAPFHVTVTFGMTPPGGVALDYLDSAGAEYVAASLTDTPETVTLVWQHPGLPVGLGQTIKVAASGGSISATSAPFNVVQGTYSLVV